MRERGVEFDTVTQQADITQTQWFRKVGEGVL